MKKDKILRSPTINFDVLVNLSKTQAKKYYKLARGLSAFILKKEKLSNGYIDTIAINEDEDMIDLSIQNINKIYDDGDSICIYGFRYAKYILKIEDPQPNKYYFATIPLRFGAHDNIPHIRNKNGVWFFEKTINRKKFTDKDQFKVAFSEDELVKVGIFKKLNLDIDNWKDVLNTIIVKVKNIIDTGTGDDYFNENDLKKYENIISFQDFFTTLVLEGLYFKLTQFNIFIKQLDTFSEKQILDFSEFIIEHFGTRNSNDFSTFEKAKVETFLNELRNNNKQNRVYRFSTIITLMFSYFMSTLNKELYSEFQKKFIEKFIKIIYNNE